MSSSPHPIANTKTGILLVNLGSPESATPAAIRRFLKPFLSDTRVIELPRLFWQPILRGIILPFRPFKLAKKYQAIWGNETARKSESPLLYHTRQLSTELQRHFQSSETVVAYAMRYTRPSIAAAINTLCDQHHVRRLLCVALYPQYSACTTASVWDALFDHFKTLRNPPELRLIHGFHDHPAYVQALHQQVSTFWESTPRAQMLVMSFHGTPKKNLSKGDPYYCLCLKTARLLAEALHLNADEYCVSFQSQFGSAKWLQPSTAQVLSDLAQQGHQQIDIISPSFSCDCLETLEEICVELHHHFIQCGGKALRYISCLNAQPHWAKALATICQDHLHEWPRLPRN